MSDEIRGGYIFYSDFPKSPTFFKREDSISICGSENDDDRLEISDDIQEICDIDQQGDATSLQSIVNETLRANKPNPLSIKQDNVPPHTTNPKQHCTKHRRIMGSAIRSNEDKHAKRSKSRRKAIKPNASAETSHKCSFCSKTFTRKQSRLNHENSHTGKRPHKCHMCPKTFTGASALWNHIQTHKKERQHKCSACTSKFVHKFQLDYHTRENHLPDTDPKRYFPCQVCNDKFKTYDLLHRHKTRMHQTNQSATIKFTCDHCQREFKHRDKIVQHMKIHSGIKNYKCSHCNAKFAQINGKWSHERFCFFK